MGDSRALTAALDRLLGDAPLRARLGAAARAHVEAWFSVDRYVERTAAYYERLWQASRRRHDRA
jgi:glycosyltransferase involved in cell wall biosynthesis